MKNEIWGADWEETARQWTLDPAVTFLNHGSFGATPAVVMERQSKWRAEMERQPVEFLGRRLKPMLLRARRAVGEFIGCAADDLVFVPNATTGINAVVKSLAIGRGDELLIADQGYPAIIKTLQRVRQVTGAVVKVQAVPLPRNSSAEVFEAFVAGMTSRTKVAVIEQIASPTALLFPTKAIVDECRRRGIFSMVDGAHAPGMMALDLRAMGCDAWSGNFHKWTCAPKGAAGLYVRREHHGRVVPVITSHEFGKGFPDEFDWTGTADPTAYLSVPAAIEFMNRLGWDRVRKHNHELARYGRRVVSEALGTEPPIPDSEEFYGSMSLAALPARVAAETVEKTDALGAKLYERTKIEVPVVSFGGKGYLRLSAQVYNHPEQYERLGREMRRLIDEAS